MSGHRKAVSYVRWLHDDALVSASTDSTLRCWEPNRPPATGAAADGERGVYGVQQQEQQQGIGADAMLSHSWVCSQIYQGHLNTKNFTGLGVEGAYIACGSETNEVVVYHQNIGQPSMRVQLGTWGTGQGGGGGSVAGGSGVTGGGPAQGVGSSPGQFVTALTWRKGSQVLLAANSQGCVYAVGMVGT